MILAAVAVLLAGLILYESIGSSGDAGDAPQGQASTQPGGATGRSSAGGADAVTAILQRPLFRADRRPPSDTHGTGADLPADMPRLTGIVMSSDGDKAIFQPQGKERSIVVTVGDTVGPWQVRDIAADGVTLSGPDGTRRLQPKFAPGASAAPRPQPVNATAAPANPNGPVPSGPGTNGPLFAGGVGQQNSGMDRPQGKH